MSFTVTEIHERLARLLKEKAAMLGTSSDSRAIAEYSTARQACSEAGMTETEIKEILKGAISKFKRSEEGLGSLA
jgi:hypothetical protein